MVKATKTPKTSTTDAKKTLNRVMIDATKDDFYADPYKVIEQIALNCFEPVKNSNKFYIAEIHESSTGKGYRYYACHGRVGAKGRALAEKFSNLFDAKKKFDTKVREKLRDTYVKADLATLSIGSDQGQKTVNTDAIKGVVDTSKITTQKSSLPPKTEKLIKQIYEEANQAVSLSLTGSVKSDIRAPLGTLGVNGIRTARHILSEITKAIKIGDIPYVRLASMEYYRNVPRKMPSDIRDESKWLLNTHDRVLKELDILDLYEDTLRMLPFMGMSDIDAKYQALNCDISYVEDKDVLAYIHHKISTTHASNHNFKLKVVNVFEVNLKNAPKFNESIGNVRKFFHGSRSANLVGILSSHLKLPHNVGSDVVKTGAMFGSGIYFAHDCTKSANYAFGNWSGRANKYPTAFLMIADVAMGSVHKVDAPHNFTQPPAGYHSVMGTKGNHLVNHEFIVYNPNQVRVRYLVEVEKV